jgi:hypothetical protein
LKGTKKELMRLAKKYDAPVPVATTGNAAFPVGTRVTVEYPGGFGFQHGQEGMVVLRRPRCVPVVQFTSGRRYRIRLQYLRVAPIVAPAAPAPLEF